MAEEKIKQAGRCRVLIMSYFTGTKRSHIQHCVGVERQSSEVSLVLSYLDVLENELAHTYTHGMTCNYTIVWLSYGRQSHK